MSAEAILVVIVGAVAVIMCAITVGYARRVEHHRCPRCNFPEPAEIVKVYMTEPPD